MIATCLFLIIVFCAIAAPMISPHDPVKIQLQSRLMPPFWQVGGSLEYPLGTDQAGRDLLSRIIWGSRLSLAIGFGAVLLSGTIGTILGLVSGYVGGLVDTILMALVDIMLTIPTLLLAMALAAVLGPNIINLILVLAILEWAQYTRIVRAATLSIRAQDYILAAKASGMRDIPLIIEHIIPNCIHSVLVLATLRIATVILIEASLSYLGLGLSGNLPSWGSMIAQGRELISTAWWLPAFPGLAILLVTVSINLVGDRLRDVIDPRVK